MTTGYLWSGQFEELSKVINEGQPQSMELDSDSLQGHWATDNNLGIDFFIINDATFSKLCILGDNVEPCYEGASVTSPEVSKNFSYTTDFQQTLFSMMNDLQTALNSEGGLNMSENELITESAETVEEQLELEHELETPADETAIEELASAEEVPCKPLGACSCCRHNKCVPYRLSYLVYGIRWRSLRRSFHPGLADWAALP